MEYKGFMEYLTLNEISLKEYEERLIAMDDVKNPKHYKLEGLELECKDIIKSVLGKEGYKNWCHGTALKYLFRAGKKEDELKDFKKARVYIDWIIEEMEE